LWKLEEWLLAEVATIGGAPDGDVEGFLLDLVRDREAAEKCASLAPGDVQRLAVAVCFELGSSRYEGEFKRQGSVPP
jgi:hypothetical protein